MIFLGQLEKITDTKYKIGFIHYMPFDTVNGLGKTKEQLEQEGILVDSIPEPEQTEGRSATLYCNPSTKELWYEYEDIPKSPEQAEKETFSQTLAQLTLENADLKQQIQTLSQTVAQMQIK